MGVKERQRSLAGAAQYQTQVLSSREKRQKSLGVNNDRQIDPVTYLGGKLVSGAIGY